MREAIKRLIKANDKRITNIRKSGELITAHESGVTSELKYQNKKLQAILNTEGLGDTP